MANREPKARAFADGLGGEERIEDVLHVLLRNSGARVAHLDDRAPIVRGTRREPDLVSRGIAFGNCLRRVDDEIEQQLSKSRWVGIHQRYVAVVLDQRGAVSDLVPGHPAR